MEYNKVKIRHFSKLRVLLIGKSCHISLKHVIGSLPSPRDLQCMHSRYRDCTACVRHVCTSYGIFAW